MSNTPIPAASKLSLLACRIGAMGATRLTVIRQGDGWLATCVLGAPLEAFAAEREEALAGLHAQVDEIVEIESMLDMTEDERLRYAEQKGWLIS